jgi:hypothetical protein
VLIEADMYAAAKESAGSQHDALRLDPLPFSRDNTTYGILVYQEIFYRLLQHRQAGLTDYMFCDSLPIQTPIRLCAGCPHSWAFASVQYPKLNSSTINSSPHNATECVHLFDNMALPYSSDCWITRHLADGIEPVRNQECASPSPRCG